VQYVIRPQRNEHHDYRGYAGRVAGGVFRVGDDVMVLPSGLTTTITGIDTPDGAVTEAGPGRAVTLLLADDLSVSRGDMICRPNNRPRQSQALEAMLCWMDDAAPLQPNRIYSLKHTTKLARAKVTKVLYRLNISNLHREQDVEALSLNEIGRVELHTTAPLFFDDYHVNRTTGSFILVDEHSGQTCAAGMLLSPRT
jgi:bifunctional enzyme CysN/CysC